MNSLRIYQKKSQRIKDYLNRKYELNRSKHKDSSNGSKPRIRLLKETTNELIKKYEVNRFPTREEIEIMAKDNLLKFDQVKCWFNERRRKLKHIKSSFKHSKEDVAYLKKQYEQNRYPSKEEINKMVPNTKLTFNQIYKWFNFNRYKLAHPKSVVYSDEINDYLLAYYEKNNNPDWKQKEEISAVTKLNPDQITDWFQNKRQKLKARNLKKKEEILSRIRHPMPEKELFYLLKKFDKNSKPKQAQI